MVIGNVDWVRCKICSRTYVNKKEAILGGCAHWSKPLTQDGVFSDNENTETTHALFLAKLSFEEKEFFRPLE